MQFSHRHRGASTAKMLTLMERERGFASCIISRMMMNERRSTGKPSRSLSEGSLCCSVRTCDVFETQTPSLKHCACKQRTGRQKVARKCTYGSSECTVYCTCMALDGVRLATDRASCVCDAIPHASGHASVANSRRVRVSNTARMRVTVP